MVYSPHPLQRQAVHGLGHRPGAGARHGRDGAHHVRRGLPRGPHGHPQPDQRELAAGLGLGDARRGARLRRGQPGDAADAVHPGRRDGPGHRGRRLRPDPRRGARRDDLRPARPAGRAGRPRVVRELDVDAVGRADVRDAGAGARAVRDGRAGPPARRPVPLRRLAVRLEDRRRAGRLRVRRHAPADRPRRRQLRPPRRRLARGRARRRLREVHPRRRPVRDDGRLRRRRRHVRERPGARRDPDERAGHALPRQRPHAGQLRDRLLPLRRRRQQQLRAVAGGRLARRGAAGQRHLEEDAGRVRGAAARPRRSTRRSSTSSPGARRRCRTPRSSISCCSAAAPR